MKLSDIYPPKLRYGHPKVVFLRKGGEYRYEIVFGVVLEIDKMDMQTFDF